MNNNFEARKPPIALIPPEALREVAKAMDLGGDKYSPYRFREGPPRSWTDGCSAVQRHLLDWLDHNGSDHDPESGLNHLAHAAAGCLILLASQLSGHGVDDRFKELTSDQ